MARKAILSTLLLLAVTLAAWGQTGSGRYLYVVRCDAAVDKIDTRAGKKIASVLLPKQISAKRVFPAVGDTFDGCLANGAEVDSKRAIFYTVVPVQAESKTDGTKDYKLLGFSLPGFRLISQASAGESLDTPPHLTKMASGKPRIVKDSEWTIPVKLDAAQFSGEAPPHQVLEISEEAALLRLFTDNPDQLVVGVLHRKKKELSRLQDLPLTAAGNIHLAPGGAAVLVEEMSRDAGQLTKTGTLQLFDAWTSRKLQAFADPNIKKLYFLTVTPSGTAVYHAAGIYWFLKLDRIFANDADVFSLQLGFPPGAEAPSLFYFDR